jgi:hypothetical protein
VLIEVTAPWPQIRTALQLEQVRRDHAPHLAAGWVDVEVSDDLDELEAFTKALGAAAQFPDGMDPFVTCLCGVVMEWLVALAICSRIRTAQMSLSFNGDFCSTSLPLFQGS